MTRLVMAAGAFALAVAAQPATAQYSFGGGGAAGCYDPATTSPERQRLHQSMGTPACRKKPAAPPAKKAASAAPSSTVPDAAWLVGGWASQGGRCASGDNIIFARNGGYSAGYAISGRWRLTGNRVSLVYRESEPGDPPGPEMRETNALVRISANEMKLDGYRYKRCPAKGGVEPWFPRERFTTR